MSDRPLYIAFLWHMHQPYYKNPVSGEITMPWVRLHAIKDYLDMVRILEDFPNLHQTFNVVPSLFEQIEDLLNPDSRKDKAFELTLKKAGELTENDKIFLLRNFFMANWETMIRPFPRYADLLAKRGKHFSAEEAPKALKHFTKQDYIDLQVLFNLVWFDPSYQEKDSQLKELIKKGKYYSEEDKITILDKQLEIMRMIIPTYKKMQDEGKIEVSVSPFYHPILPLLCNSDIAKTSYPEIKLPKTTFRHPEDAKYQINSAIKYYAERFGRPPRGMWPSEGSVSEEVVDLAIEAGLDWAATDEEILFKSLGRHKTAEELYRPYSIQRKYGELALIFRDKALSDSVGFIYQSWPAEKAAADLTNRLRAIRDGLPKGKGPFLVSIILDGENAWEYYPNDGGDFLYSLYKNLDADASLKVVTVSEFLRENPSKNRLDRLYPGSWINANFTIWIGHEEDNHAWEYLSQARDALQAYEKQHPEEMMTDKLQKAWKEIYIAEGSDWNWWYGDDHSSANDDEFDRLFRTHVLNIYKLLGQKPPEYLLVPIKIKKAKIIREPSGLLAPAIDGIDTNYFEWINAGLIDAAKYGGTMHQSETIIKQMYFGFDMETLYLRFDLTLLSDNSSGERLNLDLLVMEKGVKISIPLSERKKEIEYTIFVKGEGETWTEYKKVKTASLDKILELAVKFEDIRAKHGETLKILTGIEQNGLIIERCPEYGPVQITLPGSDYESQFWTA
ncbi:MAG: glycoside hydrolase family 57 protein [Candidatus Omnitrophota bacterium]|nr:glycoside hydrolase family 57 protein [Candidatus Omnitrophota bacterium]